MHIHIIQYYMLCIYIYCLECQHANRDMNHKWKPHKFIGTHRPFDPPEALDPNFVAEIYFTLAFLRLFSQGHHFHHCHRWQLEAFSTLPSSMKSHETKIHWNHTESKIQNPESSSEASSLPEQVFFFFSEVTSFNAVTPLDRNTEWISVKVARLSGVFCHVFSTVSKGHCISCPRTARLHKDARQVLEQHVTGPAGCRAPNQPIQPDPNLETDLLMILWTDGLKSYFSFGWILFAAHVFGFLFIVFEHSHLQLASIIVYLNASSQQSYQNTTTTTLILKRCARITSIKKIASGHADFSPQAWTVQQ